MSEQVQPTRRLVAKLAEVMNAVHRVPKNGYNEHFRYAFAKESDVLDALRKELADRQVMVLPSIVGQTRLEIGKTSTGATKALTEIEMEFTFYDGETGEELTRRWRGVGLDTEDKGLYKGVTGGEKYFLLKAFLIPTGDDPEESAQHAGQGGRPAPPQQARRQGAGQARTATPQARPATAPAAGAQPDAALLTVTEVSPKEKGDKRWTEITFSTGEVAIALDLKVIHDATRFKQAGTPVDIKTTVNDKRKVMLTGITAAPASEQRAS